jgi:ATP-dependent Clp protease ATP-binding subunit ClpA
MFNMLRQRFRDMRTLKTLFTGAEKLANVDGQKEPGAEHLLLMALQLPDGTARRAFERLCADPEAYRAAIRRQYEEALKSVGVSFSPEMMHASEPALERVSGLYKSKPSAQSLMQTLTHEVMIENQKNNSVAPLLSAHVILAATSAQHGTAVRALRTMGIDLGMLAEAAREEIAASHVASH